MTSLEVPVTRRVSSRSRPANGTAIAILGVAVVLVLCACAITLHAHNGSTDLTYWWFGNLLLAVVLMVPASLLLANQPTNPIGWLIWMSCVAQASCALGREYLVYGARGATAPGWTWVGWLGDACWLVSVALVPVMILLFPDQPLDTFRRRLVLAPTIAISVITVAMYLLDQPGTEQLGHIVVRSPAQHWLPVAVQLALGQLAQWLLAAGVVYAVVVFTVRYRRTSGEAKAQYRWTVWAGSIALVELASEFVPNAYWAVITGPIAQALLAGAITVGILRHRLFDIDVVLNRTLMFVVLTAFVIAVYVGATALSTLAVRDRVDLGPGLIATGLVALALTPARTWVQQRIDRLVYGQRRDPYGALRTLGNRLADDDRHSQLDVVVHTVREALKLPYVAIRDVDGTTLADAGRSTRSLTERPLTYRNTVVGALAVQEVGAGTSFGRDDLRLLDDLARQAGAAVHTSRLTDDLRASRARLVASKEEERRRLRRDLHDGLGPQLAAVGLKLDAATTLMAGRPDQARAIVDNVRDDIRSTIADIRVLVYGLRPPALDELGLLGALRECVQRFDTVDSSLQLVVSADELPALPAAVEVAAYWIVNEAVTNVVRHARATKCTVTLGVRTEHLDVRVEDDGCGLPVDWRPGIGTSSMAERAAELDGTLNTGPGGSGTGTQVLARLPLSSTSDVS